jgi:hypothetical protein
MLVLVELEELEEVEDNRLQAHNTHCQRQQQQQGRTRWKNGFVCCQPHPRNGPVRIAGPWQILAKLMLHNFC